MKLIWPIAAGVLLAIPCAAVACTCCGADDWRRVVSISPNSYEADLVSQLQLGPGLFRTSDVDEWSISSVERGDSSFVFHSEVGDFHFRPRALPEHRAVDITFITQPQYQLTDVADIYHEIILAGVLEMPDLAAKHLGQQTLDVTVVLRGVGNMCLGTETIERWLINSSETPAILRGSGAMLSNNSTHQNAVDAR